MIGSRDVIVEEVGFRSAGAKISARLYRLSSAPGLLPGIVHSNGFMGVQDAIVPAYAQAFAEAGYASLTFDYRGFGLSEGGPALSPLEQVRDLRNALTYLESREEVDAGRIGIFGDAATGGGNACQVAAIDARVRCLVTVTAMGDGDAWLRAMRTPERWAALQERLARDRLRRVRSGRSEGLQPIGEVLIPSEERRRAVAEGHFQPVGARLPEQMTMEEVEELMAFKPVDHVHRISPRAAMWMCYDSDPVAPSSAAEEMYERAGEPKRLVYLRTSTHYYRHTQGFHEVTSNALDWFEHHLRGGTGG